MDLWKSVVHHIHVNLLIVMRNVWAVIIPYIMHLQFFESMQMNPLSLIFWLLIPCVALLLQHGWTVKVFELKLVVFLQFLNDFGSCKELNSHRIAWHVMVNSKDDWGLFNIGIDNECLNCYFCSHCNCQNQIYYWEEMVLEYMIIHWNYTPWEEKPNHATLLACQPQHWALRAGFCRCRCKVYPG